jgi:hypothetical protein
MQDGIVDNYTLAGSVARNLMEGFHGWISSAAWMPARPEVLVTPQGHAFIGLVESHSVSEHVGIPEDDVVPFLLMVLGGHR